MSSTVSLRVSSETSGSTYRMPGEWEEHESTWLAWPHEESDWPGKFNKIEDVYIEILKELTKSEKVDLVLKDEALASRAKKKLDDSDIENYQIHIIDNDRSWLRDSAPTCVYDKDKNPLWLNWKFNAWSKYDNFSKDTLLNEKVVRASKLNSLIAEHKGARVVLEGGAIDSDGQGTLLVTEECLISPTQERNPGFKKEDYEKVFKKYLGVEKTIWLGKGVAGDDTHGHIDGVCRFVAPAKVVLCGPRKRDESYREVFEDNLRRIKAQKDAKGREIEVIEIPLPQEIKDDGDILPASYTNFLIANKVVLIPIFKDPVDKQVLDIFKNLFPNRKIVGVDCRDFILGLGAIHCITQSQFR